MKQDSFNLDGFDEVYKDIDYLEKSEIENITGDNIFISFVKENDLIFLSFIASINGKIYNFSSHKYLNDNAEILFVKALSDNFPSNIWRLVYITNYDIISIDIDDDKYYLVDEFEENYTGRIDKNAKVKVLRNNYKTS